MTKKELIDSLTKYADDAELYNVFNTFSDFKIFDGEDFIAYQRDESIRYWTDRCEKCFAEAEEANARMIIANEHLTKRETKKWRSELNNATMEYNSKNNLLAYCKKRLEEMITYPPEYWKKSFKVK